MAKVTISVILVLFLVSCEQRSARIPLCYDNLRRIEIAKDLWAKDGGSVSKSPPSWGDLRPYFPEEWSNNIPLCPSGGTYHINPVGQLPSCYRRPSPCAVMSSYIKAFGQPPLGDPFSH